MLRRNVLDFVTLRATNTLANRGVLDAQTMLATGTCKLHRSHSNFETPSPGLVRRQGIKSCHFGVKKLDLADPMENWGETWDNSGCAT